MYFLFIMNESIKYNTIQYYVGEETHLVWVIAKIGRLMAGINVNRFKGNIFSETDLLMNIGKAKC